MTTETKLLRFLQHHADAKGDCLGVSLADIATALNLSRRQVQRVLAQLVAAGHLAQLAPARQHQPPSWRLLPEVTSSGVTSSLGVTSPEVTSRRKGRPWREEARIFEREVWKNYRTSA